MPPTFLRVATNAAPAEHGRPDPTKVLSGDPRFTTWNIEERDGLLCGLWETTPGKWRLSYTEWEYCRILSGRSVVTDNDGVEHHLGPGDSFILRPGFEGTWEALETTRKDYVIRL